MAVTLSLFAGAGAQFLDNNGVMLSGGLIYTYVAGTTTPLAAYTSSTGDTALANPIVLDASGRVPTGQIWLTYGQGYKFTVKTSTGTLIGTYDNIPSAALPPLVNDAASISYEQGATVTAGNFIIGEPYLITSIGSTNFQLIGAVSNTVGIYFTATGIGSGSGTAKLSRTVEAKLQDTISVKDFGAVGDNLTDDTATIQAAINYAQTYGASVYLPAATYLISDSLIVSKRVTIYGDGWSSVISVASSVSAATDIIKIVPTNETNGIVFENFSVQPNSGTPGRHAISVDITSKPVYNCQFTGLRLGSFGGKGFATLPNATPLIDGFFTSEINTCFIYNGIYLDKAGDSIRIQNNTITGANIGVYVDLVYGTNGGAHALLVDGNNITCNGGTLLVLNGTAGVFSNNNCELPTPSGVTNAAMVDIAGTAGTIVDSFVIQNNFIGSAISGYNPIRLGYTRKCLVIGNNVTRPLGSSSYVVTANSTSARFFQNCDTSDEVYSSALITDNGVNTSFIREFASYLENTSNIRFTKGDKSIFWPDSAGTAIKGLGLSAVDDFFRVGAQDPTATNGGIIFFAKGVEVGRFNPTGGFRTNTYTVATLPAGLLDGSRAFVSDATATTFASVVAGGGANNVPVYYVAPNWRIG
jgi:hypothetical protein